MKKLYSLLCLAFVFGAANATVHTVTVSNNVFTPSTVNASVGDTVRWVWAAGFHTTTSTSIPVGASSWNANIDQSNPTFQKAVTVAGTYNYVCNFHPGMAGTINVTATAIAPGSVKSGISVFPNPTAHVLTMNHDGAGVDMVKVYNVTGKQVASFAIEANAAKTTLDLDKLSSGVYFFSIMKEGRSSEIIRVVKTTENANCH